MYKISKISAVILHIRIFYWRSYSSMDLPWSCSCITEVAFGVFLVECIDSQQHDLSSCKKVPADSIQWNWHILCLPLWCTHLVEITFCWLLFYFKLLACKNASGRSDTKSAYHMENVLAWLDKVTVLLFSDERRQLDQLCARAIIYTCTSW